MSKFIKSIVLNFLRFSLVMLVVAISAGLQPAPVVLADDEPKDFTALEPYINAEMKKSRVPGLSLVIFNEREILYSKGFGVKSAATGEPVGEDTVFQAASFSKTLTAYAAMILVERGQLSLNDPLDKYLKKPYLPDTKYAQQITLRMILNHTSGLSNDSDGRDRKVYFAPGAHFSYSGAGFRYLQQVMEDVTGLPFAELMDREIIKPLAMNSSSYVFKEEWLSAMATGHEAGKAFPIARKAVNAAYSLLTTPGDMARFNQEVCHPTLLKPETVGQMLTPTVQWRGAIYWGLGFGILKSSAEDFFWHWGNLYYYTSIMLTGKESKTGVIIMTNANTGMRLAERLAIKIVNDYFLDPDKGLNPTTFDFIT